MTEKSHYIYTHTSVSEESQPVLDKALDQQTNHLNIVFLKSVGLSLSLLPLV